MMMPTTAAIAAMRMAMTAIVVPVSAIDAVYCIPGQRGAMRSPRTRSGCVAA